MSSTAQATVQSSSTPRQGWMFWPTVLILDDMCSTRGTMARLAGALKTAGARSIEAVVTHALFDETSAAMMREAGIARIRSNRFR